MRLGPSIERPHHSAGQNFKLLRRRVVKADLPLKRLYRDIRFALSRNAGEDLSDRLACIRG
jgi:hypothetical protein